MMSYGNKLDTLTDLIKILSKLNETELSVMVQKRLSNLITYNCPTVSTVKGVQELFLHTCKSLTLPTL